MVDKKVSKIKIIAKDSLELFPHSWTKGLDYECIQKDGYIILTSNEGQLCYVNELRDQILNLFEPMA